MITGAHVMIFSKDAEGDRAFLRDTLGFPAVDAGEGWLIFKMPPTELAVHPSEKNDVHELYLICNDLDAEIRRLEARGVTAGPVATQSWGRSTGIPLPGGGTVGLYEPSHERP